MPGMKNGNPRRESGSAGSSVVAVAMEEAVMFENLFLNLRGTFRAAVQGAALLTTILLLSGAVSIAKSPVRSANDSPALLDLSIVRDWTSPGPDTPHLRFRRDEQRHHAWIARFASLELRLEWDSDAGRETWSATIQNLHGKQVARAAAITETGKCI